MDKPVRDADDLADDLAASGPDSQSGHLPAIALAALGVVYGDIGTSPLYAFKQCFQSQHGIVPSPENVLGILSLIVWSLILVVSVKLNRPGFAGDRLI